MYVDVYIIYDIKVFFANYSCKNLLSLIFDQLIELTLVIFVVVKILQSLIKIVFKVY